MAKNAKLPKAPKANLLAEFRGRPLAKAPDVDPVLIQPSASRQLEVVPSVESRESAETLAEATVGGVRAGETRGSTTESRVAQITTTDPAQAEGQPPQGPEVPQPQAATLPATQPAATPDQPQPAVAQTPAAATTAQPVQEDQGTQVPAAQTVVTQPAPSPTTEAAPVQAIAAPQQPPGAPTDQPARAKNPRKPNITFSMADADAARMRSAYAHLPFGVRPRSLSDFIVGAVMAHVRELEAQYNGGEAFPPIDPGVIPTGRPVGG
ncbi:hypothetical protein ATJ97_0058 [Georgenia soli]|uniref:Uncharacterized protein n=1 Tax=Georgenia soli TaxID=638953 RepID=A0A2A9F2U1_9MICO|nr:hypothetical protein [Georgenia soli]PFG45136.1 hypothetical protein ATJ97_0058 [Georgenia soli]